MSSAASVCPRYHRAVELIGRRWTGAIIRSLLAGPARYNELRTVVPDISDRMLSERLRELEVERVITRTVVPDSPVRVEYALTAKGRALEDAILAIGKWAESWVTAADLARAPATATPPATRVAKGTRKGGKTRASRARRAGR